MKNLAKFNIGGGSCVSGFALVSTLLLMGMITLVAIGMLSLSAISVRETSRTQALAVARANSKMALMLAIGDIQKQLGPDGRVSATASLFDSNAETPEIDGVNNPHWAGVWLASRPNGKGGMETPLSRDDSDGGLRDARGTDAAWDRDKPLQWLVSRATGSISIDPLKTQPDATWVRMVNTGSPEGDVFAPKVMLNDNGAYAWWVGDEGVKAKVNTPNSQAGKKPAPSNPDKTSYIQWLASQASDPGAINPAFDISEDNKPKVASLGTVSEAVADDSQATQNLLRRKFHDLSTSSLSLLVNVPGARLKRDLTAYITKGTDENDIIKIDPLTGSGNILVPGLQDNDRIVGPANEDVAQLEGLTWGDTRNQNWSPRFGLIRNWANKQFGVVNPATTPAAIPKVSSPARPGESWDPAFQTFTPYGGTYNNLNQKPAMISSVKPSLKPVITEASVYYNLTTYQPDNATYHNLTWHIYPRFCVWNPYNIPITMSKTSLYIQVNGRREFEVKNGAGTILSSSNGAVAGTWPTSASASWLYGGLYFNLDTFTIKPGETIVFSPAALRQYSYVNDFSKNLLSPNVAPAGGRSFYWNMNDNNRAIQLPSKPVTFAAKSTSGLYSNEDFRVLWKEGAAFDRVEFSGLSQLSYLSCALRYGSGQEKPVNWSSYNPVQIETWKPGSSAGPTNDPDIRTRDGYRMRWFDEPFSNVNYGGVLSGTNFADIAPIANWNVRAPFCFRTPYENFTELPPVFYGLYTRDLYGLSWNDMAPPMLADGPRTWPFGEPIAKPGANGAVVLFDLPRDNTQLMSLAQLQHVPLSTFVWHPSYAVGNSLADPRLENRTDRTTPVPRSGAEAANNGWNTSTIASAPIETSYAVWSINNLPTTDAVIGDLSFEANRNLFDDFFLSSGTRAEKQGLLENGTPLPNGRLRVIDRRDDPTKTLVEMEDFFRAASVFAIDGGFNVNSTSVDAWKAILSSARGTGSGDDETPYPRLLNSPQGEWKSDQTLDEKAWAGTRVLTDPEIEELAKRIVREVKIRGPFLSLADFVNRRLKNDETGRNGAISAAIESAKLNDPFASHFPLDRTPLPNVSDTASGSGVSDTTRISMELMPESKAWGVPGYLTQADVLQPLAPALTARSDTFTVRAYGETRDMNGTLVTAWCEAVVQRNPRPVNPDATGLNPANPGSNADFGRHFGIVSFRWLNKAELEL